MHGHRSGSAPQQAAMVCWMVFVGGLLLTGSLALAGAPRFNPRLTRFDLGNARFLARVVEAASHENESKIRKMLAPIGFRSARLVKGRDLHCVVARRGDAVVLAFRGSTTLEDWINDLKFPQTGSRKTGLPGRVHRGFYKALDSRWEEVEALLRQASGSDGSVWVTGHSLGGGLSHLAAMRADLAGIPVAGIYTFASPKAGDEEFVRAFNSRFKGRAYRVVNGSDLVPRVAPSQAGEKPFLEMLIPDNKLALLTLRGVFLSVEYSHAGELWVFDDLGSFQGRRTYSERDDAVYWRTMGETFGRGGWPLMVVDTGWVAQKHFMRAYIDVLEKTGS